MNTNFGREGGCLSGVNLTQTIAKELGAAIVTGHFGKGGLIPSTKELCKRYGVSRIVIREAMMMLNAKGMINTRQSMGTWVTPESAWNQLDRDILYWLTERGSSLHLLNEFNQIRIGFEPAAASLAAKRKTASDIRAIEKSLKQLRLNKGNSLDAEIQFHTSILSSCNNRFYIQFSNLIHTALSYQHTYRNSEGAFPILNIDLFEAVYKNIKTGDSVSSAKSMRVLLQQRNEPV